MILRPRFIVRATLSLALFAVVACIAPEPARAIQLRWSTGTTDLTVSQDTLAVLVVQADSAEVTLPNTWRLLWTTDSLAVQFSAFDPNYACLVDTAKVDSIAPPQTPADSAANQVTAWFCSAGSSNAASAYFLANLPGGGHGKLIIVALDPSDSTQVIESNEVTFNGGVGGDYSPSILSASSIHATTELQVTVVGTDLSADAPLKLTSPDGLWSIPLSVIGQATGTARNHRPATSAARTARRTSAAPAMTTLTAVAHVPTALPEAIVESGSAVGSVAIEHLAADQIMQLDASSLADTVRLRDPEWATGVYPKDFSFYYNVVPSGNSEYPWKGLFHLMYIRATSGDPGSELGHAWSSNLRDWHFDLHAFEPRHNGGWEDQRIWAPTVLQVGDSTVMFYTGVDASNNQRIGYAKTGALTDTTTNAAWVRQPNSCYSADSTGWADRAGHFYSGAQQFRDPFVMQDPDSSGRYLMFVVGEDKLVGASTVVGVARNYAGTLNHWRDLGPYYKSDSSHAGVVMVKPHVASIVESPLAMRDSAGTGPWRIFFANANYDDVGDNSTFFITDSIGCSVADTLQQRWPNLTNLYTYLNNDGSLIGWEACEHVQVEDIHLFAGYADSGIVITRTYWDSTTGNFKIGYPPFIASVPKAGPGGGARFFLVSYRPGQQAIRLALETPNRVTARLTLYDLAGRCVRTLTDGKPSQGRQEWRWDCRDQAGQRVASGMYFARLIGVGAPRVLRVVVIK